MTRCALPLSRWLIALMFVPLLGCLAGDTEPPTTSACPSAEFGYDVVGPTFVGNQQCADLAVDEDGDGTPEAVDVSCVTPQSYDAPGNFAAAQLTPPATDASVVFGIAQSGSTSVVSCQHDLAADLAPGTSRCSGSFRRTIAVTPPGPVSTSEDIHEFTVTARQVVSPVGGSGTFDANVTVYCPSNPASYTPVPTDGSPVAIRMRSSGVAGPTTCYVDADIVESSTWGAGLTLHSLQIGIQNCSDPSFCAFDSECPAGHKCVLTSCRAPGEGASCQLQSQCSTPDAPVCFSSFTCQMGRPGEPCRLDRDCQLAGAFCGGTTCRGAPCDAHGDCPAGTFCTGRGCSDRAALDDPCFEGKDCSIDLRCLFDGVSQNVCTTGAPLDSPCSSEEECAVGLRCLWDGVSANVCALGAASGESCGSESECQVGLRCLWDPGNGYQCGAGASVGGSCSSETECEVGLKCIDSQCAQPRGEDEACPTYTECGDELYCDSGVCRYF